MRVPRNRESDGRGLSSFAQVWYLFDWKAATLALCNLELRRTESSRNPLESPVVQTRPRYGLFSGDARWGSGELI